MMEVVGLAVAPPQISVEKVKEAVTVMLSAKAIYSVDKITAMVPLVFPHTMTAALTVIWPS